MAKGGRAKTQEAVSNGGEAVTDRAEPSKVKPVSHAPSPRAGETENDSEKNLFPVVCLGASAGGLEPLRNFFGAVAPDTGCAFVVVTHLRHEERSILPELLKKHTDMAVLAVQKPVKLAQNTVYVIPPNHDLEMLDGAIKLIHREVDGVRTPIDHFLTSLASERQERAVAIILSGAGHDGSQGIRAIHAELGMVMAQDPEEAAYKDMPKAAIATTMVDYVIPVADMPRQLQHYLRSSLFGRRTPEKKPGAEPALRKIHSLLHKYSGHDFSKYKATTVLRRINRRMAVHQIDDLARYAAYIEEVPAEAGQLFRELLIGVTRFFRDSESFDILQNRVLPELLADLPRDQAVRIWAPGASTGEEAYSIAIVVREFLESKNERRPVQIFATDLNEDAVEYARQGVYPASIADDMSKERLEKNFLCGDGHCRIRREIREMLVFAPQNLLTDPPFTRLDLICCRNLLIYLDPDLQKQVLPLFHYSLRPNGVLFLGSSETIGEFGHLFSTIDNRWKIFRRKSVQPQHPAQVRMPGNRYKALEPTDPKVELLGAEANLVKLAEQSLLEQFAPPTLIINADGEVLYIHGRTGAYLEPAPGQARMNVFEMAREGLRQRLPSLVQSALNRKQPVRFEGLNVQTNGDSHKVNVSIRPLRHHPRLYGYLAVTIEAHADTPALQAEKPKVVSQRHIDELETELATTRENLQITIEELETSNEELRSLNEEYQSTNEELQSTNEELQTSREEMQSLNEELATVNDQLNEKIVDLTRTHHNLEIFLNSLDIPTIFLDRDLKLKRYTIQAIELINLVEHDIGRPLAHLTTNLNYPKLIQDAAQVLESLQVKQKIILSNDGRRYLLRILPYRTSEDAIDGVVLTFIDVEEAEQMKADVAQQRLERKFAESIVETVRHPLIVLDEELHVVSANPAFYRECGLTPDATIGTLIYELDEGSWASEELQHLLEEILPAEKRVEEFKIELGNGATKKRKLLLNARAVYESGERTRRILVALEPIKD